MTLDLEKKRKKKGFFVASQGASRIAALCHRDRFIKMARPTFTTSIFKANPIRFLFENVIFFFTAGRRKTCSCASIDSTTAHQRSIIDLGRIHFYFYAFECRRRTASKVLKDIGLSLQQHQILNHCITPNGLLQEHMLN